MDHADRRHSKVGASSAKRWLNCPGSVDLCEAAPSSRSKYASEGTAAHQLAEMCLTRGVWTAKGFTGSRIFVAGEPYLVTDEMADAVGVYLDAIHEALRAPGATLKFETEFDISWLVDGKLDMYGTNDAVVMVPFYFIHVFDLKYGEGVYVDAEDNDQLRYYGIGALQHDAEIYPEVRETIVQPRFDSEEGPVRTRIETSKELMAWGTEVLGPGALRTIGSKELCEGEWCRFCKAGPSCPRRRAAALQVCPFNPLDKVATPIDLPAAVGMTPQQLGRVLDGADLLEAWLKSIRERAFELLQMGCDVPGRKLANGRKMRSWANEAEAIKTLAPFLDPHKPPALRSVADVEKELKKLGRLELLDGLVQVTQKPSMVPADSSKPALTNNGSQYA